MSSHTSTSQCQTYTLEISVTHFISIIFELSSVMMRISIPNLITVLAVYHTRLSDGFVLSSVFELKYFFIIIIWSTILEFSVIFANLQLFPYSLALFILSE